MATYSSPGRKRSDVGLALGFLLLTFWLGLSHAATTVPPGNATSTSVADPNSTVANAGGAVVNANSNGGENEARDVTTVAGPKGFFDDDNNKAMFIVLPVMVLVYGGCASIYCIHKARKSYKRYKRRKMRERMHAQIERERLAQEAQEAQASCAAGASSSSSSSSLDMDGQQQAQVHHYHRQGSRAFMTSPSASTGKDGLIRYKGNKKYDEREGFGVRNPGYKNTEDTADPSMGLIDIQLKEALAMIDSVVRMPLEVKSRPDLQPKENENTEPINRRRRMKKKVFVPQ